MHGLTVTPAGDSRIVRVHPYLGDFGRRELRQVIGGLLLAFCLLQIGRWSLTVGSTDLALATYVLAVLSIAGGLGTATWIAVSEHRRSILELDVHLGREELELVWLRSGGVTERSRVALRDVGRVDVREVGYQRWQLALQVAGRGEVTIPMERDPQEAARWLARELSDAGRDARSAGP